MRWGKFILFFQAVTTLIIGIIFFLQVFNIQYNLEEKVVENQMSSGIQSVVMVDDMIKFEQFKKRFFNASYILVVVSLMEIIIIWRLFDHESI